LDRHTYTLDPVHPPLSRLAIGLPLYLAGERFPKWPASDPRLQNYNDVGNSVLYDDGHYLRNLTLARVAILPFLVGVTVLVFCWARQEYGDLAGVLAALLLSTLPMVLAFSGMAYTDVPTACMQFAAFFGFTRWLKKPTASLTISLGVLLGLALLSKATTLIYLPAGAVAVLLCRVFTREDNQEPRNRLPRIRELAIALIVSTVVLWGGYGFSVGRVRESMQLSGEAMPSFQHFPSPLRHLGRQAILQNFTIPAPALIRGLAMSWVLNKEAPPAYLLGKTKKGGWWYFFLFGIAVKTPISFLLLACIGAVSALKRGENWTSTAPLACALAVLLVTMPVKYDAGLRHVMVVFPLLAVVAGCGAASLWAKSGRPWGKVALVVLLASHVVSSFSAGRDFISYFNKFAGRDPSQVLISGCDLDCGQDVFQLSQALQDRHVTHFSIAIWSSADLTRMNLPAFDVLEPFEPATGWVAVSLRSLRFGDVFHKTYPAGAFAWLQRYSPVAMVGRTILLYQIPENSGSRFGDSHSHVRDRQKSAKSDTAATVLRSRQLRAEIKMGRQPRSGDIPWLSAHSILNWIGGDVSMLDPFPRMSRDIPAFVTST
jgi:hypothetical protein